MFTERTGKAKYRNRSEARGISGYDSVHEVGCAYCYTGYGGWVHGGCFEHRSDSIGNSMTRFSGCWSLVPNQTGKPFPGNVEMKPCRRVGESNIAHHAIIPRSASCALVGSIMTPSVFVLPKTVS